MVEMFIYYKILMFIFRPKVYFVTGPFIIFSYYLDLIKDTILVTQLMAIAGGTSNLDHLNDTSILIYPTDFMSAVSMILLWLLKTY